MAASKTPKTRPTKPSQKKDRAAEIANTFEWLITAFILAFVFRAFVMEAFRIPTGSMADTLKGAHFELRCPECGYKYEFGFTPREYDFGEDTVPPGTVGMKEVTRCPSCGYQVPAGGQTAVAQGDRILVLKCIYQFVDPERWDVIVFKNPTNPSENYIKRLIGLPNEEIEIIDGDIYVDGLITRRPAQVQKEHWMPVYDNDYRPVNPNQLGAFNHKRWRPPFDFEASSWRIAEENPTEMVLDAPSDQLNVLTYGRPSANDFRIYYAYNDIRAGTHTPQCGDLMVRFYVEPGQREGLVGAVLSKYGVDYVARLDLSGQMTLSRVDSGDETVLDSVSVKSPKLDAYTLFKFANVDHQLLFEYDGHELRVDLGRSRDAMDRVSDAPPRVAILGAGKMTLSHLAIYRDIYYLSPSNIRRAQEGDPFKLNDDEFFVLGDNSPNSEDGRYWDAPHVATKGTEPPRAGIVPRYYLVGKALFVYWPSGFEFPWPKTIKNALARNTHTAPGRLLHTIISLRWIPNIGQMRFIYGGKNGYSSSEEPAGAAEGQAP